MKYLFIILISSVFLTSCSTQSTTPEIHFDKELTEFNYPFKVHSFEFNSQNADLTMRYMDIGKKTSPTVVLLHGKNFAGFYWKRVANDLLERGYRVIIPDQIGFGKSTKPESYQYSFAQLALNTKLLLEHLKVEKFTITGHSMGGMLAVNMAYLYESSVEKLILINPIGLETYLDYVKFKDTSFFYKNELKKTLAGARKYQQKNYYDGKWANEYEALLVPLKGQLNSKDWLLVAWNNALTYGPIFSDEIVSKMPKIRTKTYLIMGTRDKTGPGRKWKKDGVTYKLGNYKKLAIKTKQRIKNSTLYTLEGLGHMPFFEDYDRFSKIFKKVLP